MSPTIIAPEQVTTPVNFEFRGGAVLSRVHVKLIYWGSFWKSRTGPKPSDLTAAIKIILASGYLSALSQYQPPGSSLYVDQNVDEYQTDVEPPKELTDRTLGASVPDIIREVDTKCPSLDGFQSLYVFMMPEGVSCQNDFAEGGPCAGEHDAIQVDGRQRYYAWVLHGSKDRMTAAFSEELVEAITNAEPQLDPKSPAGWVMVDNQGARQELCDVCAGVTANVNGVRVQTYYSIKDQDCVAPIIAEQQKAVPHAGGKKV